MTLRCPSILRDQRGDAIIETAVVLPAFTLLLFGIFQFSLGITSYLGSTYAVRSAARWASVRSNNSLAPASSTDVTNYIKANPFIPTVAGTTISVGYVNSSGGGSSNTPGAFVYIYMVYPLAFSMPFYSHTFNITTITVRYIVR